MTTARKPEFPKKMREEALEWRIRIDADDIDADERRLFDAWLRADPRHEQAFDRATSVWDAFGALNEMKVDPAYFRPTLLHRLRESLPDVSLRAFGGLPVGPVLAGLAAAVTVGFVVLNQLISQAPQTEHVASPVVIAYTTVIGETKTIMLSDESEITLGPASRIEVAMSADARSVRLVNGAAMFEVASDAARPFSVQAEGLTARVLGTVFDVRNNGGVVRLSVSEGVVEARQPCLLTNEPTQLVTRRALKAGEQVTAAAASGLSSTRSFRAETFAAWREGRLRYVGAPLSELIADANRYSSLPIRIETGGGNIDEIKVAFSYDPNDIDRMLDALPTMFPVTVDRTGADVIVIRSAE